MPGYLPLPDPLSPIPLKNPPGFIEDPMFPPVEPIPTPGPAPPPEPVPAPEPPIYPVPPKRPGQPGSLPDLGILAALIVALGLALVAAALADFFNWLFRRFMPPALRRRVPQVSATEITQALTNRLGAAEQGYDQELGASFHKLAGLIARVGRILVSIAQAEAQLARRIVGLEDAHARTQTALHHVAGKADVAARGNARNQAAIQTEQHRAQTSEHVNAQRIRQLEHHQKTVLEPELEALRHRIPELKHGLATAWDEIGKHSEALGIAGVTAATAVAIDKLGAGWIRCEANQLLGRENCKSNGDFIRRLFANALPALAATDLCLLADGMELTARAMLPAMLEFVDVENALIGCHGATKAPPIVLNGYNATPVVEAIRV